MVLWNTSFLHAGGIKRKTVVLTPSRIPFARPHGFGDVSIPVLALELVVDGGRTSGGGHVK